MIRPDCSYVTALAHVASTRMVLPTPLAAGKVPISFASAQAALQPRMHTHDFQLSSPGSALGLAAVRAHGARSVTTTHPTLTQMKRLLLKNKRVHAVLSMLPGRHVYARMRNMEEAFVSKEDAIAGVGEQWPTGGCKSKEKV